jgi:hypothetical protein
VYSVNVNSTRISIFALGVHKKEHRMSDKVLFDCRGIPDDCIALFMDDGRRVLVDKRRYFAEIDREIKKENQTEDINVREPVRIKRPGHKRSGPAQCTKYKQNNPRRIASRKRIPLLPFKF